MLNRRRYRSPDTGTVYQRVEEVNYLINCNLYQLPTAREKTSPWAAGEPYAVTAPRASSVVTTTCPFRRSQRGGGDRNPGCGLGGDDLRCGRHEGAGSGAEPGRPAPA